MNVQDLATYLTLQKSLMDRLEFIAVQRGSEWRSGDEIDLDALDPSNLESYLVLKCMEWGPFQAEWYMDEKISLAALLAPDEVHIEARKARLLQEEEERKERNRLEAESRALRERADDLETLRRLKAKYPDLA